MKNFVMKFKETVNNEILTKESHKVNYEMKIVWKNVIIFTYIHLSILYGLYLFAFYAKLWTIIWFYIIAVLSGFGITAGAHRLWCHRSYKAKWPLRLILVILNAAALQDNIFVWVRDHRTHHKFTDTDADPYNARRGFFFSHIGWLMVHKHSDVIIKGATIDMSDIEQDPLVVFQRKWYSYLVVLCCFIIPILVPWLAWNESFWYAWHMSVCRYGLNLNFTWAVNSVAHLWGEKPYNKSISSTDNIAVSIMALGEGWHNYHHIFPWDYKTAEFGNYGLNFTTAFIDFFVYLGLAYDLKTASADMIKKRSLQSNENKSY
ncbi:acyl-CoA Delta(11) desaturase-like [Nylanderia fulva]|uniref:acyl-CoA Delta(11) desaturase-like n=1 Tax=Nylanderia fulva TaxID=613905 RepID=UPI0010FB3925|nr:acyl-CoA Delta(11) desaturase-like [Nylanderia fulva]